MAYLFLALAIIAEITGTNLLKASAGFEKLYPFFGGLAFFGVSLFFMTLSFKTIPLSVGYSIWSGVGTAGAAVIGILIWKEKISLLGYSGMLLIIIGIIMLNVPSTR